jgi:L-methionine (R)-S-oxide reductase
MPHAAAVLASLAERASRTSDRDEIARAAVDGIREALPQASFAGIYWLEGDVLVLGPYVGPPTEHARIPVGKGVCGAAVAQDRDQVVDDVSTRPDYLACSPTVRSEIVVLVRRGGRPDGPVVGQIDLDSDARAAFSSDDHAFLRAVSAALGALLG